jgi:hypothetical protein
LRVLIDASFDLQRAVDELGFWEIVNNRCAILRAIAASGNPADKVVSIRGREGQNFDELFRLFFR